MKLGNWAGYWKMAHRYLLGYKEHRYVGMECFGCSFKDEGLCLVYAYPRVWWRNGKSCPMATHIARGGMVEPEKKRIGQQKQRRRR